MMTGLEVRKIEQRILKQGEKIGRLTILSESFAIKGRSYRICRCDCGNERRVLECHLKSGHSQSCGCITKERMKERANDLHGRRFGRLRVIEALPERSGGAVVWRCICDCGSEVNAKADHLMRKRIKSCGCLREDQRKINMKNAIHFTDGTCIEKIACQRESAANTSGHRGVTKRPNGTYRAQMTFKGKRYNLGTYPTFEQAVEARLQGEEMYTTYLEAYYAKR